MADALTPNHYRIAVRGGLAFFVLFFIVAPALRLACYLGLLDVGDDERHETMGPGGDDVW